MRTMSDEIRKQYRNHSHIASHSSEFVLAWNTTVLFESVQQFFSLVGGVTDPHPRHIFRRCITVEVSTGGLERGDIRIIIRIISKLRRSAFVDGVSLLAWRKHGSKHASNLPNKKILPTNGEKHEQDFKKRAPS